MLRGCLLHSFTRISLPTTKLFSFIPQLCISSLSHSAVLSGQRILPSSSLLQYSSLSQENDQQAVTQHEESDLSPAWDTKIVEQDVEVQKFLRCFAENSKNVDEAFQQLWAASQKAQRSIPIGCWAAIIDWMCHHDRIDEALACVEALRLERLNPTASMFRNLLLKLCDFNNLDRFYHFLSQAVSARHLSDRTVTAIFTNFFRKSRFAELSKLYDYLLLLSDSLLLQQSAVHMAMASQLALSKFDNFLATYEYLLSRFSPNHSTANHLLILAGLSEKHFDFVMEEFEKRSLFLMVSDPLPVFSNLLSKAKFDSAFRLFFALRQQNVRLPVSVHTEFMGALSSFRATEGRKYVPSVMRVWQDLGESPQLDFIARRAFLRASGVLFNFRELRRVFDEVCTNQSNLLDDDLVYRVLWARQELRDLAAVDFLLKVCTLGWKPSLRAFELVAGSVAENSTSTAVHLYKFAVESFGEANLSERFCVSVLRSFGFGRMDQRSLVLAEQIFSDFKKYHGVKLTMYTALVEVYLRHRALKNGVERLRVIVFSEQATIHTFFAVCQAVACHRDLQHLVSWFSVFPKLPFQKFPFVPAPQFPDRKLDSRELKEFQRLFRGLEICDLDGIRSRNSNRSK